MSRKPRIVKNGFVNIHDISFGGGVGYINWINPTKMKLKQREKSLFSRKIEIMERCVNKKYDDNNNLNVNCTFNQNEAVFKVNKERMKQWFSYLFDTINGWKGIDSNRIRKPIITFSHYFERGKNWWDQKKLQIYKQIIFPDLFQMIYNYVCNGNKNIYNIFKNIFNETVVYPATKPLSLIPAGCFKYDGKTNKMHQFLYNKINKAFDDEFWQNHHDEIYSHQRGGILKKIQNKFDELTNSTKKLLRKQMSSSSNNINSILPELYISTSLQSKQDQIGIQQNNSIQNQAQNETQHNNNNNNILITFQPITPNLTVYTIQCPSNNFYAQTIVPSHSSSILSSNYRWSPYNLC